MTDKDLQINGPSKSASKVPSPDKVELKKKKRMAHVVDPMKMSRELFVDDESYATYQQQLKLMEQAAKVLFDQFADVEAEKDDLTTCVRKMENEKGKMENEKECYEKVLRIISVRSKLENFVDKNYPLRINNKTSETVYGKPDSSYCDALNEMLVSQDVRFTQDVFIVMIRKRLDDRNITPAVFMKFARWLYNQMSDKACHKMAQFSPPLPKFDDDGAIKEMLKAVEIDEDDPAVICIQIILQPLDLPPIVTGTTP